jgi:hypothetical protein
LSHSVITEHHSLQKLQLLASPYFLFFPGGWLYWRHGEREGELGTSLEGSLEM